MSESANALLGLSKLSCYSHPTTEAAAAAEAAVDHAGGPSSSNRPLLHVLAEYTLKRASFSLGDHLGLL